MFSTLRILLLLASAGLVVAQTDDERLTNVVEVLSLSPERASEAIPVSVKGVVTAVPQDWGGPFFVPDETAGIFVENVSKRLPAPGDVVRVTGISNPGGFAPIISQPRWEKLGTAPLPDARTVSAEELMSGIVDAQRVQISGIVRGAQADAFSVIFELAVGGYRFRAYTPVTAAGDPELLVGTRIRVRGTVATWFHPELRQLVAVTISVPRDSDLIIEKAFPGNPFDEPVVPLDSVAHYHHDLEMGQRIHVRGMVIHQRPGMDLFLQDSTGALQVRSRQADELNPGDVVEAIGFPDLESFLPVLNDATFRKLEDASGTPVAKAVTVEALQAGLYHADLITIRGKLLERTIRHQDPLGPGFHPIQVALTIQASNFVFTAEGPAAKSNAKLAAIPLGSLVELTGISMLQIKTMEWGDVGTTDSLQLLLPGTDSVRVLKKPSWLTPGRLMLGLGLLSVVLMLALVWSVTVSRKNATLKIMVREKARAQDALLRANDLLDERVRERTAQLKFEMNERKEAEVRFKATLTERTRLAQELHDTLEQSLTGIGLQLDAAATLFEKRADGANRPLEMARNLMSRSQLELRRSIWDLHSRELEQFDLPNALRISAQEIMEGTGVELDFASTGEPHPLSEILEENLLRIGREALSNVLKHADATRVKMCFEFSETGVSLKITDDGRGFDPKNCAGSSEGHFGLSGMSERAKRIGGRLEVNTAPGNGTCIEVNIPKQLPVAEDRPDNASGMI